MTTKGGFGLTGEWVKAMETMIHTMTDGVDPRDLQLPVSSQSELAVEKYVREYCATSSRASMAIMWGIATVGVCTATQGAWVLPCPIAGGGVMEVPCIHHFIGVAPSGWRKSTALDAARRPLVRVLRTGVADRERTCRRDRSTAERAARQNLETMPVGTTFDSKQFATVYTAGICPHTLLRDPTVEALRNFIVDNGGVGSVQSAEADLYRNLTLYNSGGASSSLTFFLDLWQQEEISSARVGQGLMSMPEVAFTQTVLFQSDVFAEVTGGSGLRGSTADSFVSRGMFGRIWVVKAEETGGFEAIAAAYGDDDDFDYDGLDGMSVRGDVGNLTPLGWALKEYEDGLESLVAESNYYRMGKGIRRAWEKLRVEHGADLQVPEPEVPQRRVIKMDKDARLAYRRVQRLQLAVEAALNDDLIEDDVRSVFTPLAARLTQHIMREALVMALGSGYRTVTGAMITDAATRIIPWRLAHTADALLQRADEIATENVARMVVENPRMESRAPKVMVLQVMASLSLKSPSLIDEGIPATEIVQRVKDATGSKSAKAGVPNLVRRVLEELHADPTSGVDAVASSQIMRYRISREAIAAAQR